MDRVIFLDIDGVLNSNFWNDIHQREICDGTLVDGEKIKLLATLVKRTSAKLVLHSGWRMWFDDELKPLRKEAQKLVELLAEDGLFLEGVKLDAMIRLTWEDIEKADIQLDGISRQQI